MPRLARTVFAGIPHHITQRGNRQEDIFFNDGDRGKYLGWLQHYSERHKVDVLAYCLMTNHIHLILVPSTESGLQDVLKPLHLRYAQYIHRNRGWKGHVWQGRYFSSPLDEGYTWAAIRYVERNPVRAKMIRKAEQYPWSSAAGHCDLKTDTLITKKPVWQEQFQAIGAWSEWLAESDETEELNILRRNIDKGLPCGKDTFISNLERLAGRSLIFKPQGRPRKDK